MDGRSRAKGLTLMITSTAKGARRLAKTGADIALMLGVAVLLVAAGVLMLRHRRG